MTLGEDNILFEAPIILLMKLFKYVRSHYPDGPRALDAYEHVWTGIIVCLLFSWLGLFCIWFLAGIPIVAFIHILWKEVWHDRVKRTSPEEWQSFYVDLTTRTSGFIFGAPFWVTVLILHFK